MMKYNRKRDVAQYIGDCERLHMAKNVNLSVNHTRSNESGREFSLVKVVVNSLLFSYHKYFNALQCVRKSSGPT